MARQARVLRWQHGSWTALLRPFKFCCFAVLLHNVWNSWVTYILKGNGSVSIFSSFCRILSFHNLLNKILVSIINGISRKLKVPLLWKICRQCCPGMAAIGWHVVTEGGFKYHDATYWGWLIESISDRLPPQGAHDWKHGNPSLFCIYETMTI